MCIISPTSSIKKILSKNSTSILFEYSRPTEYNKIQTLRHFVTLRKNEEENERKSAHEIENCILSGAG